MIPQQKNILLEALLDGLLGCVSAKNLTIKKRDINILNKFQENIHAAIKELEEMPTTEEVK